MDYVKFATALAELGAYDAPDEVEEDANPDGVCSGSGKGDGVDAELLHAGLVDVRRVVGHLSRTGSAAQTAELVLPALAPRFKYPGVREAPAASVGRCTPAADTPPAQRVVAAHSPLDAALHALLLTCVC